MTLLLWMTYRSYLAPVVERQRALGKLSTNRALNVVSVVITSDSISKRCSF